MRISLYISVLFLFCSCYKMNSVKHDNTVNSSVIDNGAEITILGQESINFGEIIQGEKVNLELAVVIVFKFPPNTSS